ncbi:MAG: hypothetical protein KA711_13620 [Ideonella sp. WA131b]|nr:hypothetical protein [Ideonella sp. WA131b]
MKRALAATLAMLATAAAWAQGGAATHSVRLLTPEAAGAVVGGIGVLGAPSGDADEACARAGIAALRDDLEL